MVTPGGDYSNQRVQLAWGQRDGGASRDARVPLRCGAHASSPPPITADEHRNPAALFNSLSALAPAQALFFLCHVSLILLIF